ncbi:MAG: YkgJ family cysteine cluster protein [Planctomycetota bacterium]
MTPQEHDPADAGRPAPACSEAVPELAARLVAEQRAAARDSLLRGRTALHVLQAAADACARASAAGDASPDRPRRACDPGCAACCHMAVSVTALEALYIAARLQGSTDQAPRAAECANLRERIAITSRRVSHLTLEARAAARVPCALLSERGECTIYQFRPLGCRGWTSFSRQACEAALADAQPSHGGPVDRVALAGACAVTEGLEQAGRDLGLAVGSFELHAAVLRGLDTPDAAARWLRGEDVFAGCPRVTSDRLRPPT